MPIEPIEPMSQLSLDIGRSSVPKPQKMQVIDEELGKKFRETLNTEKEATRVLREMKRDQAIEKAREFVKEGKSAFEPKGGGGGGGMGGNKLSNRDLTKAYKAGGTVSSASKRADGCCVKGKTRA